MSKAKKLVTQDPETEEFLSEFIDDLKGVFIPKTTFHVVTKDENEALQYVNTPTQSVAVVSMIVTLVEGKVKIILNEEYQNYNNRSRRCTKMPATMFVGNENYRQAMTRGLKDELNLVPVKSKLAFVAKFSSTVLGQDHYKVYVLVTETQGELPKTGKGDVTSSQYFEVQSLKDIVAKAQKAALAQCIIAIQSIDMEHAFALM